jgi:hypothetical protein
MLEQDIKLLWGRAAERCSFPGCRIKLTQDKKLASASFPLGEQAHIVGATKKSPRGKSNLIKEERDSYYNLILLCPNQHEYWVEHTLSESKDSLQTAQSVIYTDLIDSTVEACHLDSWDKWATRALSTNMNWDEEAHNRLFEFYNKILGAIWPKTLPELECALKKLTYEIYESVQTFAEHCKPSEAKEGILVEERFYKSRGWIADPNEYQQLFNEYDAWQDKCKNHVIEATKAVNWFADIVRRDINPLFFATKGKFFVIMGPYDELEFRSYFFEYNESERRKILSLCEKGWNIARKFT